MQSIEDRYYSSLLVDYGVIFVSRKNRRRLEKVNGEALYHCARLFKVHFS